MLSVNFTQLITNLDGLRLRTLELGEAKLCCQTFTCRTFVSFILALPVQIDSVTHLFCSRLNGFRLKRGVFLHKYCAYWSFKAFLLPWVQNKLSRKSLNYVLRWPLVRSSTEREQLSWKQSVQEFPCWDSAAMLSHWWAATVAVWGLFSNRLLFSFQPNKQV